MQNFLERIITTELGNEIHIHASSMVHGGDINETFRVDTNQGIFFIKLNMLKYPEMFQCEYKGLKLLGQGTLRVPKSIAVGNIDSHQYLILEFIQSGPSTNQTFKLFGEQLAQVHSFSQSCHGLDHDNYIGSIIQQNTPTTSWCDFYLNTRLRPLVEKAIQEQLLSDQDLKHVFVLGEKLTDIIPEEPPSLLHGDLWSGNYLIDTKGNPVIFDPAVYYGHREMDIAMTKLFGGFHDDFYDAYNAVNPMVNGWRDRVTLFQLYPLLVHVNLFGRSYVSSYRSAIQKYL